MIIPCEAGCPIGRYEIDISGIENPSIVEDLTGVFQVDTVNPNGAVVNRGTKENDVVSEILPRPIDVTIA